MRGVGYLGSFDVSFGIFLGRRGVFVISVGV